MFLGLALILMGLSWMLNALGVYDDQTFGVVGSLLVVFTGLLTLLHPRKGRRDHDVF